MLKVIRFKRHLDNGYGKPVCDYNAVGKTVKWGEGAYSCSECHAKVKIAQQKQDQIDLLNSQQQDIYKQIYVTKDQPRNIEPEAEHDLRKQLISIERKRKSILSTINTVESDIMAQLTAHRYYEQSQKHGVLS
jgi:hypothetical protein